MIFGLIRIGLLVYIAFVVTVILLHLKIGLI